MKHKFRWIISLIAILLCCLAAALFSACGKVGGSGNGSGNNGGGNTEGQPSDPQKDTYDMSGVVFADSTVPYDGQPHSITATNLPEGVTATYDNNGQTNAGTYTITAHFTGDSVNYNLIPDKTATLTISKATYDMSGVVFADSTVPYDGQSHSITATNLPEGVTATYDNNGQTNAGTYTITAHFTGDTTNYNPIPDKTAKLTIVPLELSGISFNDDSFVYDGTPKSIYISGDLPEGITVDYEGNGKTTVGVYEVTAKFTATSDYKELPDLTAKLTITKATYDMSGVVFGNSTVPYDGQSHSITATNLPTGVTATYDNNGQTNAGTYTITAHFTGDSVNYNPIPDKTATLTISKATYDMSGVVFADSTVPYDGQSHSITATNLPEGVTATYDGNGQTNAGTYTITAHFTGDSVNYNAIPDKTATLTITRATHKVTFKQEGQTDIVKEVLDLAALAQSDIPTPVQQNGYTIVWEDIDLSCITEDITVNAVKSLITYTITYELYGGTNAEGNPESYTIEDSYKTLLSPQKENSVFGGWYDNADYLGNPVTRVAGGSYGDITLHARWAEFFIVSATGFEIDYSTETPRIYADVAYTTQNIDLANRITVSANCTWKLYADFIGSEELRLKAMTLNVGHNIAYIIVFHDDGEHFTRYELDIYRLDMKEYTFMNLGDEYDSGTIQEKSTIEAPTAPERVGYDFIGWAVQGSTDIVDFPYTVTEDITFVAQYTPINYTITYHLNNGENAEGNPESYDIETADITLANATRAGYTFKGWFEEATFSTQVTIIAHGSYGEITLYAKWEIITYTITYNLNGGDNSNDNPASYNIEDEDITLQPATRTGYTFEGWFTEAEFETEIEIIETDSVTNYSLYAKWSIITYTITYELNGGDNSNDNPESYDIETADITLANATRTGYTFEGWFEEATFSTQVTIIAHGSYGEITLYAKWESITYTITYNLNGGDNSNDNPANYDIEDEDITLKPATRTGYTFEGWFEEETFSTQVTIIAHGSHGEITLYAKWETIEYSITYHLNDGNNSVDNPKSYDIETATITLQPATRENYIFMGWFSDEEFKTQVTEIEIGSYGDKDLYAKWNYGTEGLIFTLSDDTYSVTGYTGSSSAVIIPAEYNGKPVTSIANDAFKGYSNLTSVEIGNGVTTIGDSAFSNCTSLTSVEIGNGVTTIGDSAFYKCTSLVSIIIPDSVTTIGGDAFYNCTRLTIYAEAESKPSGWNSLYNRSSRPVVWYYGGELGMTNNGLKWALRKDGTATIYGFVGKITYIEIPAKINSYNVTTINKDAFRDCTSLTSVEIGNSVTTMGNYAFSGCTRLKSVTIGNGVTTIGNNTFYNCTSLESITIPDSVPTIGEYAFYNCTSLESVLIGKGVTTIYNRAFYNCTSLETVYWNAINCTSAGSSYYQIFEGCTALTEVIFGDEVQIIPSYAFYKCSSLVSVTIGNSVPTIGDYAFYNCTSLTSVEIGNGVTAPDGVTTIGFYAFYNCTSLTSVEIGNGVTAIDNGAFKNCTSLTSVEIGNGVTTIGNSAFSNCTRLISITIPDSVTTIGEYAFSECSNLTSVVIGNGVTTIGKYAFSECSNLTSVTIPDGVTTIGERAFGYCTSLTSVTIPDSVTTIDYFAFGSCRRLESVYYGGTVEQWDEIAIDYYNNGEIINATRYYFSEEYPFSDEVTDGNFWHYDETTGEIVIWEKRAEYSVTFDLNGGEGTAPDSQTVEEGGKAVEPAEPVREGYLFLGWFDGSDEDANEWDFDVDEVRRNVTLYAHWQLEGQGGDEDPVAYTVEYKVVTTQRYVKDQQDGIGGLVATWEDGEDTGNHITVTENLGNFNGKDSNKNASDGRGYADYGESKTGKGVTVTVSEGVTDVTIKAYVSHSTQNATRPAYLSTKMDGTSAGDLLNSVDIVGASNSSPQNLYILEASGLGEGTYYIFGGSATIHFYAVIITYTVGGTGSGGGTVTPPVNPDDPSGNRIIETSGAYDESAYAVFKESNPAAAEVFYKKQGASAFTKVDAPLIRATSSTQARVDIVGLSAGTYDIKVVNSAGKTHTVTVSVTAYDRSGYAHFNYTDGIGAYNDDGTLKSGALVIYVTDANKNDILDYAYSNGEKVDISSYMYASKSATGVTTGQQKGIGELLNNRRYASSERGTVGIAKLVEVYGAVTIRIIGTVSAENPNDGTVSLISGLTDWNSTGNGGSVGDNGRMARIYDTHDVTIEGVGEDASIYGWGVHFVANSGTGRAGIGFEVRNITFANYPEDAIGMEGQQNGDVLSAPVQRCWVHHNTFLPGYASADCSDDGDKGEGDGSCDFKRGMYFTLAYNYFEYCHKTNLIGSNTGVIQFNITMHHNWWYNCGSRIPLVRQSNIHFYNNYVYANQSDSRAHLQYVHSARDNSYIFSEANYYEGCKNITDKIESGAAMKSWNNVISSCTGSNVMTEVTGRAESVPSNCSYNGTIYSDFDTNSALFYYKDGKSDCLLDDATTAKEKVMKNSGANGHVSPI